MIKWDMCAPFVQMVDPELDGAPHYLEIIKKPMSLMEVRNNLGDGIYSSFDNFKNDVNLIWENAIKYNGENSIIGYMAAEAKLYFDKKMLNIPENDEEEWIDHLSKTTKKFYHLLSFQPKKVSKK